MSKMCGWAEFAQSMLCRKTLIPRVGVLLIRKECNLIYLIVCEFYNAKIGIVCSIIGMPEADGVVFVIGNNIARHYPLCHVFTHASFDRQKILNEGLTNAPVRKIKNRGEEDSQ